MEFVSLVSFCVFSLLAHVFSLKIPFIALCLFLMLYTSLCLDFMQSGSISSKSTGILSSFLAALSAHGEGPRRSWHMSFSGFSLQTSARCLCGQRVLLCCTDICACLHSWHLVRRRLCMHIPLPWQSVHSLRTRKCWQRPTPPQCLHLSRRFPWIQSVCL